MDQLLNLETVQEIRELGILRPKGNFAHDLYNLFDEQSDKINKDLAAAVTSLDLNRVRHLAHSLKGTSANIGALALSRCAEEIENLLQDSHCNIDALTNAVHKLPLLRQESLTALKHLLP
jgi:HPt (histidine-containing phosphotransfer) domain-containing protein